MIPLLPFDCPRTCPRHGDRWCRFRPVLDALGPVRVDSHTARVKVEYDDPGRLRAAVEAMGGAWLGPGTHALFEAKHRGYGFTLPGWQFPLVLEDAGDIAYDAYGGRWGDVADLERLKTEYVFATTRSAAAALGWQTEVTTAGELLVHHPDGGTLTVAPGGTVATAGFHGAGCHAARGALGLAVEPGSVVETAEACRVPVTVRQAS